MTISRWQLTYRPKYGLGYNSRCKEKVENPRH